MYTGSANRTVKQIKPSFAGKMPMNKLFKILFILIVSTGFSACVSKYNHEQVRENLSKFSITAPDGYQEISLVSPELRKRFEDLTPASNTLLACFIPNWKMALILSNPHQHPVPQFMTVQEITKIADQDIYLSEFRKFVNKLESEGNRMKIARYEASENFINHLSVQPFNIAQQLSVLEVDQPIYLEVINSRRNSYGLLTAVKIESARKGITEQAIMINGSTALLIRDRLVFATVSSLLESEDTIKRVKSISEKWTNSMVQANPNSLPEQRKFSFSDLQKVLEMYNQSIQEGQ